MNPEHTKQVDLDELSLFYDIAQNGTKTENLEARRAIYDAFPALRDELARLREDAKKSADLHIASAKEEGRLRAQLTKSNRKLDEAKGHLETLTKWGDAMWRNRPQAQRFPQNNIAAEKARAFLAQTTTKEDAQ